MNIRLYTKKLKKQLVWFYKKKILKRSTRKETDTFDSAELIMLLGAVVLVSAVVLSGWFVYQYLSTKTFRPALIDFPEMDSEESNVNCQYRRFVDGVCVSTNEETDPRLVGVMVENHVEAWPQSGLSKASVVYEFPVEGQIPRFLAIFPRDVEVSNIGPVRSARPYAVTIAQEYGSLMYMHVGGSPEALEQIETSNIFDLNEFYRGWYYWRAEDRAAPHNTYTSSALWNSAIDRYGEQYPSVSFTPWVFVSTSVPCAVECVNEIEVRYAAPSYVSSWVYVTSTNQYQKFQAGEPQFDRIAGQLVADTVIVQHVKKKVIDSVGRLELHLIGEGEAEIYTSGNKIIGRWKKDTQTSRTQWFDMNGQVISLNPGKIWIHID